jgi:hypothetical protein
MVVREDREKAAAIIAAYLRGEVDNFALDDATMGYTGKDESIRWIGLGLWPAYDDIKRHRVSLNKKGWQVFRRCIAFLQTDLELPRSNRKSDNTVWPFQTRQDIFTSRPRLKQFGLPRYNLAVHSLPIRSRIEISLIWLLWIVIAAALVLWLCIRTIGVFVK